MKHTWTKSEPKAGQEGRDICLRCKCEREEVFIGKWRKFTYSRNGTNFGTSRPECFEPIDKAQRTIFQEDEVKGTEPVYLTKVCQNITNLPI